MEFPPFDDFKSIVLKEENMEKLMGYKVKQAFFQVDLSNHENLSTFVSKLIQDVEAESVAVSFRILEAYHEWLSQHLNI